MHLSPYHWLRDACIDWLVIATAMALVLVESGATSWIVAILIIGNRRHALGILGHDGAQ